jgi:hypothetical protein
MVLSNFQFTRDLIGLDTEVGYIDLHNHYDFVGCLESNGSATLSWQRLSESGASAQTPKSVSIVFGAVSYLEQRGVSSRTLMEFGFFPNASRGRVEYNGQCAPSTGCEFFVARFEGGGELALLAGSAMAHVSNGA